MRPLPRVDELPRGGKCVGEDTNLWFPHADRNTPGEFSKKYRKISVDTLRAKQICSECPIMYECLCYAMHHETFGIWGGKTERERHQLRRKMNITVIPREPINILLSSSFASGNK